MPDTSLLWIMSLFCGVGLISTLFVPLANARGDLALRGVQDGLPLSMKTRRLILFTHYIPLAVFWGAFTMVAAFGFIELARSSDNPRVAPIGYMAAVMGGSNTLVWFGLAGVWVLHTLKELGQAERN